MSKNVWVLAAILIATMIVGGGLVALHADREMIILVVSTLPLGVVAVFISSQLGQTHGAVTQVATNVNGNLGKLLDLVASQTRMLAAAPSVTDPATPPPTAPGPSPMILPGGYVIPDPATVNQPAVPAPTSG